jgi:chemotaxis response regulator CheB
MKFAWISPDATFNALIRASVARRSSWLALWDASFAVQPQGGNLPEVLLVDVDLPEAAALVRQWSQAEVSVVLLARNKTRQAEPIYRAMEAGAIAVVEAGEQGVEMAAALDRLARVVRAQGRTLTSTFKLPPGLQAMATASGVPAPAPRRHVSRHLPPVIALGASAGGPKALAEVLSGLPESLPAAVLVALHFDRGYDRELIELLAQRCALPLAQPEDFDRIRPGRVYMSRTERHLTLDPEGRLGLLPRREGDLYCPSVDRLFESIAQAPVTGAAALLTGMGDDGARGLAALRARGFLTIAQDAGSSAVFGMPRAAVERDAAAQILPLGRIAAALVKAVTPAAAGAAP